MLRKLVIASIAAFAPARSQVGFRPYTHQFHVELVSPWKGPGSAQLNPAALSETRRFYGHLGSTYLSGSDAISPIFAPVYQFAADLPAGFSAGLGGYANSSGRNSFDAIVLEDIMIPGLAFAWPLQAGTEHRVSLGLALPIHHFKAFGATENHSLGLDLGLLYVFRPHAAVGWFRVGMAFQRLARPTVDLPDHRGSYKVPGENDFLLTWTSPGGWVEVHSSFYRSLVEDPEEYSESPGLLYWKLKDDKTWGIQISPWSWLALKVERPLFTGSATYGAVGRLAPVLGHPMVVECDFGHDGGIHPAFPKWLWNPSSSEEHGFFLAFSVGAEF